MEFSDSADEAEFRLAAKRWLDVAVPMAIGETGGRPSILELTDDLVREARVWQKHKARDGWAFIGWPEKYGGRSASPAHQLIWDQEESRYSVPPNIFSINQIVGMALIEHANRDQLDRFLPPMRDGTHMWAMLFTEPGAGSDCAAVRTTAARRGSGWVLRGEKAWTWGANYADWGTLLARTDPRVPKHLGLSYFLVDMRSAGIEISPLREVTGRTQFSRVVLNDVWVPDSSLVGPPGGGWQVAISQLSHDRLWIGTGRGGWGANLDSIFDWLQTLAKTADYNGKPAIEDPAVQQRMASFLVDLEALRFTGYRMMTALSHGDDPGPEASLTKLVFARLVQEMADYALELQGSAGILTDGGAEDGGRWQNTYLEAPAIRIGGGTDEIQKNIIASQVLRLPPEVRLDKDRPFEDIPGVSQTLPSSAT